MAEVQHEIVAVPQRVRKREKTGADRAVRRKRLAWTAAVVVWGALAFGAYSLAQHYMDGLSRQLQDLRATNETRLTELQKDVEALQAAVAEQKANAAALLERLGAVESGLELVKEELSLAGDTLSSSDQTKKALNNRINDLSRQLEELRKLIRRLEEAARVY